MGGGGDSERFFILKNKTFLLHKLVPHFDETQISFN
jgi:hypothetical protein